jgi:hypothetical protein
LRCCQPPRLAIFDHCQQNFAVQTNREITNKDPIEYQPKIVKKQGEDVLTAQLVPLDSTLWEMDNYEKFLEVRRSSLIDAMNTFMEAKCAE